jgi:uncharacterized membrane protein YdjX (TVP38/TMEM64 family)
MALHDDDDHESTWRRWLNWHTGLIALALLAVGAGAWYAPFALWFKHIHPLVVQMGWAGPAVFVLIYIVGTVLLVPGIVMSVAAGLLFGLWGIPIVSAGGTIGATLAFIIARYLARGKLERLAAGNATFKAIDEAVSGHGGKLVALLRLSPMVPFSVSNYLYGLTDVKLVPYILATWVGTIPVICLEVYLGAAGKVGLSGHHHPRSKLEYVFFGVGLGATIGVTLVVTYIARRALNKARNEQAATAR